MHKGLTQLIEKEYAGEHNPVTWGTEQIYCGNDTKLILASKMKMEIIIPYRGDFFQEINININTCVMDLTLDIYNVYVETEYYVRDANNICDDVLTRKTVIWPLRIFRNELGFRLLCDYEISLLHQYQVTKLIISAKNDMPPIHDMQMTIYVTYCFIDSENRWRKIKALAS